MNFPILSSTAKLLFAALSVDTSLPKQKRRAGGDAAQEANEAMGATAVEGRATDDVLLDRFNPGRNVRTVCAQTYQNYKSALKWWHTHSDPVGKSKEHSPWPSVVEEQINRQIAISITKFRLFNKTPNCTCFSCLL